MMIAAGIANRSSFEILVLGGGYIGYAIILLSVAMVALAAKSFLEIRRGKVLPGAFLSKVRSFLADKKYREALEWMDNDPSFVSRVLHSALSQAPHGYNAMERALEESAEERTTKMLRSIEWLNLIGNIGPMMGLLATVWGMIGAFFAIVEKGWIPNPADLAESIGIALVTTLQGLSVAIPALGIYGFMRNRIDSLSSEAITTSQELVSQFRTVAAKENS